MNHDNKRIGWNSLLGLALLMLLPVTESFGGTFYIDYSGSLYGNNAEAHGTITFDETLLPNPSDLTFLLSGVEVTGLSLTVSNATSGNGSFDLADFDYFSWNTAGVALDLSRELVGQPTLNGDWGTYHSGGAMGEFGLIANTNNPFAPTSVGWFSLQAYNDIAGTGDKLYLTSLRPQSVPEPSALWLFGAGFLPLSPGFRRRV